MPRLKLVFSPNQILKKKNSDISFPLSKEIKGLIDMMIFACKKNKGVGLAAPQIGKKLNLAIINLSHYEIPAFPIINPKIITNSGKSLMEEGCLSIPEKFGLVNRPEKITVQFYNTDGKKMKLTIDGLPARVFQHEIDHLNGILIEDKWEKDSVHRADRKT